ncbi:hypothetical protein [Shimazuella alba]|uniref:Uncharacterized protein n=1 Tax=Shimazuella alba TaxID=2690964 RepID=A0A6I4VX30_9BACL|nr:hypothetical protein [Shimazuella alba]MXQ54436.1 hypothetical protein [Shimazuella alba]
MTGWWTEPHRSTILVRKWGWATDPSSPQQPVEGPPIYKLLWLCTYHIQLRDSIWYQGGLVEVMVIERKFHGGWGVALYPTSLHTLSK